MEIPSPHEQTPKGPELPIDACEALAERLGFVETEALSTIRELALEAFKGSDEELLTALKRDYHLQGEVFVSSLEQDEYMGGQIGLIIAMATLHRDTGNLPAFLENIRDAKMYAYNLYDDGTVSILERAPSVEIARILAASENEEEFDTETLREISELSYEEAFEDAYSYLIQAGLDAGEILAGFIADS